MPPSCRGPPTPRQTGVMEQHVKTSRTRPPDSSRWEAAGLAWLAEAGGARVARVADVADDPHRPGAHRPGAPDRGCRSRLRRRARRDPRRRSRRVRLVAARTRRRHLHRPPRAARSPHSDVGCVLRGPARRAVRAGRGGGGNLSASGARSSVARAGSSRPVRSTDHETRPRGCTAISGRGNVLVSPEGVVLIDPAGHGGHRETDWRCCLVRLLRSCPPPPEHSSRLRLSGPLRTGWRERTRLHQLHPLAVPPPVTVPRTGGRSSTPRSGRSPSCSSPGRGIRNLAPERRPHLAPRRRQRTARVSPRRPPADARPPREHEVDPHADPHRDHDRDPHGHHGPTRHHRLPRSPR